MSDVSPMDIEAGSFLKQSLDFQMDGNRRMALAVLSTERARFAIKDPDPIVIPIPFHSLKEAVAQILVYELELALSKLPLGTRSDKTKWPKGAQGMARVADLLMDAATAEAAGQAMVDGVGQPELRPNLNVILGGD